MSIKPKSIRKSESKPVRRHLIHWDVKYMFQAAQKHAPKLIPGMILQFLGRLTQPKLFALTWACWDGHSLHVVSASKGRDLFIEAEPVLKAWLDATAPGSPGASNAAIMTVSREEYRQGLEHIRKLANVPFTGKYPLYRAGMRRRFAWIRETVLSPQNAPNFAGTQYAAWEEVVSGLTPEALRESDVGDLAERT